MAMLLQLTILIIAGALLVIFAKDLAEFAKKLWEKTFFRHVIVQLGIALIVVSFAQLIAHGFQLIVIFYYSSVNYILTIIGSGQIDTLLAKIVVLLLLPLSVCLVPQFIYWLASGKSLPFFYRLLWICFTVLATVTLFPFL